MTETEANKLYKSIATDFKIIARKTGLMELEYCDRLLHDIKILLANDFLKSISLVLEKPRNIAFKVKQFRIDSLAMMGGDDRPGGNDWEDGDGESLNVVFSYSQLWHNKSTDEKTNYKNSYLKINWGSSSVDTTFPQLQKQLKKKYNAGINCVDRVDYE